jgi:predicted nucleic acid-binding protein
MPRALSAVLTVAVAAYAICLGNEVIVLAIKRKTLGLSAYDAVYLDLARRERLPLATLDERLRVIQTESWEQSPGTLKTCPSEGGPKIRKRRQDSDLD